MSSNRILVSGYAQRVFLPSGIEYRNFTPDLVGNQFATGNSVFTSNNFVVTTNLDPKSSIIYQTDKFSPFYTQENLSIDETIQAITNGDVTLNVDSSRLDGYAYFGSLKEFVRVSLENIITNWPASIYVTDVQVVDGLTTGSTVLNYSYDSITNISTFDVDTNYIINGYNINYLSSGTISPNVNNPLKTLATSYGEYIIDNDLGQFPIIGYTGATTLLNDVLSLEVQGNPFTGGTSVAEVFHIRPNDLQKEKFFKSLNNFENYLLNRKVLPIYTAEFSYPSKTDLGVVLYQTEQVTWPVSDGYNIDFQSQAYVDYVGRLVDISENFDANKTDLIHRFLTADSISTFDTIEEEDEESQKITKLLRIYGRNFDDVKDYIDGISFGNIVTYNKKDNVPDELVKTLARSMGWNTTSSLLDNDVIEYFLQPANSSYSGQSVGMTTAESEIELWRRLILNSPWLFKSKGTRKAIEFLLGFIGTPNGLVEFKEYIYKADRPVDVDLIQEIYEELGITLDPSSVWFDSDGYPQTVRNTPSMYFQKGGLWYRETAGQNARVYIAEGNNPHIGPYDGGKEYLSNFTCLVPDFEPLTIVKETITSGETKLYVNYNNGRINDCEDICQVIETRDVTLNGTLLAVQSGDTNSAYGSSGGRFYSPISQSQIPVTLTQDVLNVPLNVEQIISNSLWGTGSSSNGRLNTIGVWNSSIGNNTWIGFTKCIELTNAGTYTVAIAADNRCRFSINGQLYVNLNTTVTQNFTYWHMYQVQLAAGTNIIEMEGWNASGSASFGAEIYEAPITTLSGMTTESELSGVTVFSTGDLIGVDDFTLGTTNGYSCPTGFALNICDTGSTPTCSRITQVPCPNPTSAINTYFTVLMPDNSNGGQCYTATVETIDDPYPTVEATDCGCPIEDCDDALRINISRISDAFVIGDTLNTCDYTSFELLGTGEVQFTMSDGSTTTSISSDCCSMIGFNPFGYAENVRELPVYTPGVEENTLANGIIYQLLGPIGGSPVNVIFFDGNYQPFSYVINGTQPIQIFSLNDDAINNNDNTALNNYLQTLGFNTTLPLSTCMWNGNTITNVNNNDQLIVDVKVVSVNGTPSLVVSIQGGILNYNVEVLNANDLTATPFFWVIEVPYGTPDTQSLRGNPNTAAPVPITIPGNYIVKVTDDSGNGMEAYSSTFVI